MLKHLLVAALALLTLSVPSIGFAQEGNVSVFQLSSYEVEDPLVQSLQEKLNSTVQQDETKVVGSNAEMTLNEIVLTIGCEKVTAECLSQVSDYVETDMFVYGSVQRTENIYLVNLGLFDLRTGKFIRKIEDRTVEGDEARIVKVFGTLVENLLYGNVGQLVVQSGASAIKGTVKLDGKEIGAAPGKFEGLSLGEHIVVVESVDGQKMEQQITLQRNAPARVVVNFTEVETTSGGGTSSPLLIPGWVSVGVGVVGIGFGLFERSVAQSKNDELSSERFQRFADQNSPSLPGPLANEFRGLRDERDSANTLSVIGLSVGGVALAAGGIMLYSAYTSEESSDDYANLEPEEGIQDVKVQAGLGSVHMGFSF